MAEKYRTIEYMCRNCGCKQSKTAGSGRPAPGFCSKKAKKGPHSWVINRKY